MTQEELDNLIHHQVRLRGLYTGVSRRLEDAIESLRDEIIKRMEATKDLSSPRSRGALIRAVNKLIDERFDEYGGHLTEELEAIAKHEKSFAQKSAENLGLTGAVSLTSKLISSIIGSKPKNGEMLDEMVSGMSGSLKRRLRQQIRIGAVDGEDLNGIAERIKNETLKTVAHSGTIIRTAGEDVTERVRAEVYHQAGAKYFQLAVVLDSRTSPYCRSLNTRKVYRYDDPYAPFPPFHPNCRTLRIPLLTNKPIPLDTFSEWLARQSKTKQREILGKGRYELYQKGVAIEKFVDQNNHVITLERLRELEGIN